MKPIPALTVLLSIMILAPFSTLLSAQETSGSSAVKSGSVLAYRPPMRGAPASRVGGGSRGVGDAALELSVLAPDHTGLTTHSQPTLYWYISKPANARLDVTVIDDKEIDPLLEHVVGIPKDAGIQHLDLATIGTTLEPGVEYRWFVAVIPDEKQRSSDLVASGTIQYTKPDAALVDSLASADTPTSANIYAGQGVWYDAVDAISRAIQQNPGDAGLRGQRAALLEQVGLETAAEHDRRQ